MILMKQKIFQGMSKEILDAAVLKQFKDYLLDKELIYEELPKNKLNSEMEGYIKDKFPGSKGSPSKMVEVMSSPSPSQSIQTQAIVNPVLGNGNPGLAPPETGNF